MDFNFNIAIIKTATWIIARIDCSTIDLQMVTSALVSTTSPVYTVNTRNKSHS